jgi:site-specific recombinase XerD
VDRFLAHLRSDEASPHTLHHYREDLRAFAAWWAGALHEQLALDAVTGFDLQAYRDHLRDTPGRHGRHRKPATINAKLAAIRSMLQWAARQKLIAELPPLPRKEKRGRRVVRSLDKKQRAALLRKASSNPRDLAVIQILIETGVRVDELVALRWYDVDPKLRKGWLSVRSGKGRKPRLVPLSKVAREAFVSLRKSDQAEDDPVFRGQRGPLRVRGVQEILAKYEDARAGLDNLSPHMLRHTFAIIQRDRGTPWPTIAALMGHESVKTTMDNYAVASDADLMKAVKGFEDEDGEAA